jgi:hypothetical protein
MIGDHHGRAADTATLLFTATDGILGTHTIESANEACRVVHVRFRWVWRRPAPSSDEAGA